MIDKVVEGAGTPVDDVVPERATVVVGAVVVGAVVDDEELDVGVVGFERVGAEVVGEVTGGTPGGGCLCEGTAPSVGRTAGALAGIGARDGTGTPGMWTRPKPIRSDHQIDETCTTVPDGGR